MDKQLQNAAIEELLELHEQKSPFLDETWEKPDLERYTSQAFFDKEREHVFQARPFIAAHASEIAEPGDFMRSEADGRPILLVRGEDGVARAFYNVCRHRGAQLVSDDSGCEHRFRCPYHAWTWSNTGDLIAVPHEKTGFPDLDRSQFGLHQIPCQEHAGWIWISLAKDQKIDVEAHLGELNGEFGALDAQDHVIFASDTLDIAANWKLLVEGGIEAYHFRVAHRNTIAPLFMDNLSSYQCIGQHLRSVLPRNTLPELKEEQQEDWNIREHANVLYSIFHGSQFLVQEDNFVWIASTPMGPDRTRLRLSTMIPRSDFIPEKQKYWSSHHKLTMTTLDEDFVLGEGIQRGLTSGANPHLNFGRFEGALTKFNQFVDEAIA